MSLGSPLYLEKLYIISFYQVQYYYGLNYAKGVKQGIQLACIRCPNAQESS